MTRLRDPTTAPGAFRDSLYHLPPDPDRGDKGIERAIRETGKKERTLYGYHEPGGMGPPIGVAQILDDIHKNSGGIEHNFQAWMEWRESAGSDGSLGPDPAKLLGLINSHMEEATRQIVADRGEVGDVLRNASRTVRLYAELTEALMERLDREGAVRNRSAEDRRPFRPTQATGPVLVPSTRGAR